MQIKVPSILVFFFLFEISIANSISGRSITSMEEASVNTQSQSTPASSVYIVYTEKPADEPEPSHIRTLATVLGSEEAAKDSLLYVYKNAAAGFSAKLTPDQVAELEKQPGVLQVVPSQTYQLQSGTGAMRM